METAETYRSTENIGFKYAEGNVGIYPKCFHTHYEIYLLIEGQVEYVGESLCSKLKSGDVILVPPGVYHQFSVDRDKPYRRCVLELQPSFARRFPLPQTQRLCNAEDIALAFSRLRRYAETEDDFSAELMETVASEIILLSCRIGGDAREDTRKPDDIAVRSMAYIRKNLNDKILLRDVAEACHCSVSTVCHSFRLSYGISIMQYIQSKKMMLARQALDEGRPAAEVGLSLGYRDYATFYRAFVKEFGCSPKAARK